MIEQARQSILNKAVAVLWTSEDEEAATIQFFRGDITEEQFHQLPLFTKKMVTSDEIDQFCGSCDNYNDGRCMVAGLQRQARYVAIDRCVVAAVENKSGEMTENGFSPDPQKI